MRYKKLLQMYEELDEHIDSELEKNPDIACKEGCDACCKNTKAKLTSTESFAIIDYIKNVASAVERITLLEQMKRHEPGNPQCPFLVDSTCGINDVRPSQCRTYFVHGEPCTEEQHKANARKDDVHQFDQDKMAELHRPLIDMMVGAKYPEQQDKIYLSENFDATRDPIVNIRWATFVDGLSRFSPGKSDQGSN